MKNIVAKLWRVSNVSENCDFSKCPQILKLGTKPAVQNVWFDFRFQFVQVRIFKKKVPTHAGASAASPEGIIPALEKNELFSDFFAIGGQKTMKN